MQAARRTASEVRAERHGRDRRVRASRDGSRARSRGCREFVLDRAARARRQSAVSTGWCLRLDPPTYQTVMAHAEIGGAAREVLPGVDHARVGPGPARRPWDNGPLIERDPRACATRRRSWSASRRSPNSRSRRRWPTRRSASSSSCAISPAAAAPVARDELAMLTRVRRPQARAVGRRVLRRAPAAGAARARRGRAAAVLSRCRACSTACSRSCGKLFDITVARGAAAPTSGTTTCATTSCGAATARCVGSFFTDLFARPNKRGGAWMDGCREPRAI